MPSCSLHPLPYRTDPSDYFRRIRQAPGAVLLDAGRPNAERGRYDLMSAWPLAELAPVADEPASAFLQRLRDALQSLGHAEAPAQQAMPFVGGLIGYLSYDFGRRLEALPEQSVDDLGLEDARFGLYAWALISDHQLSTSALLFHPSLPNAERQRLQALFEAPYSEDLAPFHLSQPFQADIDQHRYRQAIECIQSYILAGDCYQVNFAQRFQAPCAGDPWTAYLALRQACPTPFSGFQSLGDGNAILSLSPERFLKVSAGQVETRPIKGTRRRGEDAEDDQAQAQELLASRKDRAENLMIVDLLRNDLGRSCRTGSVKVPELFALESYPNVHHLVSCVTAELAPDKDALDLIAGSFPGGSITGAPKIRAMQIIDGLEPTRRGLYCGSLLYLDVRGEMDSSIAIRSLLVKDGKVSCWGGGGIVADSHWQAEYQESITKVKVLLETLERLPNKLD
ncbi:aminodeoxychorismate synthase component I [Pseudomonas sp. UBA6323]|uniref:aminodeoxychorismate synthase component I n=1 Tax=Pseudomonas sp. UBA6323 TaxID=1947329 RepID=UPI0025FA8642|nr:aminodeoxychorismate synthase component I [Pseudomonas sp. UBA6323]